MNFSFSVDTNVGVGKHPRDCKKTWGPHEVQEIL